MNLAGCLDGFLVRNLEELGYVKSLGLAEKAVCDHSLYAFNDASKAFLEDRGVLRTTVPWSRTAGRYAAEIMRAASGLSTGITL